MFSGIVERQAVVVSMDRRVGTTCSLKLELGGSVKSVNIGDSLCVNGVCLTVRSRSEAKVTLDVIAETLRVTDLGALSKGSKVNIERSLRLSDRIGGHLVTGHVDGVGRIIERSRMPDGSLKVWVEAARRLISMMVPKGSVALDGVSLTLVDVSQTSFSVCLIPHTLSLTTLGHKTEGATVNIEVDMVAKYVRKYLEQMKPRSRSSDNRGRRNSSGS